MTTPVPAANAAVATAGVGDTLHVTTDRVVDTFAVTATEQDGDTRILRLHRPDLPGTHAVTIRYTSFWADGPVPAPTLVVDGPDDLHTEQAVQSARVSRARPDAEGGDA